MSVRWQIHLLFIIQLVSMGAMEMSGPFWPVHLHSLSHSDDLFTFASIAVYVGADAGHHADQHVMGAAWGSVRS